MLTPAATSKRPLLISRTWLQAVAIVFLFGFFVLGLLAYRYSYTNNWPPEPLVDNVATANTVVWSVLSLIALLGGIGLLFAAF